MGDRIGDRDSVVHILWSGEIGGAERAVFQLARSQRREGRPVAIAFGQPRGYYRELAAASDLEVVDLRMRSGHDIRRGMRARRELKRFAIHHFHSAEPVPMLASLTCHGPRRIYTHRAGRHAYTGRRAMRYRVARLLIRRFDAITASPQATEAASRTFGIPKTRILTSFNGVDPDFLEAQAPRDRVREREGVRPETVVIATAANLRRWKRIDWLLEAAEELTGSDWAIWILGDGDDRARLESAAADSPVGDRINFLGMQPRIADWLHAADVFALPSGPGESFGNAVVEAMATGLPVVVSSDCPAHLGHVTDRQTGLVAGGPEETAARLNELIRSEALRSEIGTAAARSVRERYSIERMVAQFDEIYAGVEE